MKITQPTKTNVEAEEEETEEVMAESG